MYTALYHACTTLCHVCTTLSDSTRHIKGMDPSHIHCLEFGEQIVFLHVGGIELLSLTDLGCVLSFYRVQSALKVTLLHQYAYFFYMC